MSAQQIPPDQPSQPEPPPYLRGVDGAWLTQLPIEVDLLSEPPTYHFDGVKGRVGPIEAPGAYAVRSGVNATLLLDRHSSALASITRALIEMQNLKLHVRDFGGDMELWFAHERKRRRHAEALTQISEQLTIQLEALIDEHGSCVTKETKSKEKKS